MVPAFFALVGGVYGLGHCLFVFALHRLAYSLFVLNENTDSTIYSILPLLYMYVCETGYVGGQCKGYTILQLFLRSPRIV